MIFPQVVVLRSIQQHFSHISLVELDEEWLCAMKPVKSILHPVGFKSQLLV